MSRKKSDGDDGEKTVIQTPGLPSADSSAEGVGEDDSEEDRTVIQPAAPAPSSAENEDDQRTVIAPSAPAGGAATEDRTVIAPASKSTSNEPELDRTIIAAQPSEPPASPAPTPKPAGKPISGITEGQVLNHTYEIKRYIARGGMGEVFEGVNVTNEQRAAFSEADHQTCTKGCANLPIDYLALADANPMSRMPKSFRSGRSI